MTELRLSEVVSKRALAWCATKLRAAGGVLANAANEIDKSAENTVQRAKAWNQGYRAAMSDAGSPIVLVKSPNPFTGEAETIAQAQLRLGIISKREFVRLGLECLDPTWMEREEHPELARDTTGAAWRTHA